MKRIVFICGNMLIINIVEVEFVGFKKLFDVFIVVFVIGNFIVKFVNGIVDEILVMCVKVYFRN